MSYAKRAVMNLIWGIGGHFPCPKCLIPHKNLADLTARYPLQTASETLRVTEAAQSQRLKRDAETILKSQSLCSVDVRYFVIYLISETL